MQQEEADAVAALLAAASGHDVAMADGEPDGSAASPAASGRSASAPTSPCICLHGVCLLLHGSRLWRAACVRGRCAISRPADEPGVLGCSPASHQVLRAGSA